MPRTKPDDIRAMLNHGEWDQAISLLQRLDPVVAADVFLTLPEHDQEALFRRLPLDLAAAMTGVLPYFDAFVLLLTRSPEEISGVLDRMETGERMQFIEELPEEAWLQLSRQLSQRPAAAEPRHSCCGLRRGRWRK